uniref:MLO-like protein n=1 Tax=Kalanchoe fedtschenkoi TaxID=63787 RepID=A0A7N0TMR3_KALFE
MSGGGGEASLEFTPTWIVALVCTVIVALSLLLERILHRAGKSLKKNNQKPLFEALQKVKEELMLLGFISLLLTVFQNAIMKICVHPELLQHMLPCSLDDKKKKKAPPHEVAEHWEKSSSLLGFGRRLLSEETVDTCANKDKVPLLSTHALHNLHIFIFVLAITHVTFCALTIFFGGLKIRLWKQWEDSIAKENYDTDQFLKPKKSFVKQFYASVTKSDYVTLRLGFIMTHCRGNPKFNFHKYMIRALEDDFKKVVGISWYLWVFVVVFLLLNVNGWHTYFWIAFIPFILLLAVGTKLEHVITQLAHEVAEKHVAVEGDLVVQPSDDHFWFHRPRIILYLIHFILFQNAFEIAFFFWILVTYGFDSCIIGKTRYIVPRLVIGVFVQVLCSYSTLPLYAVVTQMGTHFKKAIFDDHVRAGILGWVQGVRDNTDKKGLKAAAAAARAGDGSSQGNADGPSAAWIQMSKLSPRDITQAESQTPGASQTPK